MASLLDFLKPVGNFVQQDIVHPIQSLATSVGNGVSQIPNELQQTQRLAPIRSLSQNLYGSAPKINPQQGPAQIANNWQGGAINNINPNITSTLLSLAHRAYQPFEGATSGILDKPIEAVTGVSDQQLKPYDLGDTALNLVGSLPTLGAAELNAGKAVDALSNAPKIGEALSQAPKIAKYALPVAKNLLTGAQMGALQNAGQNPGDFVKNTAIDAASFVPFGALGEGKNVAGKVGRQVLENAASTGIQNMLQGQKITPQNMLQAGIPAAVITAALGIKGGGKTSDIVSKYLQENPDQKQLFAKLLMDNRGYFSPGGFLDDAMIKKASEIGLTPQDFQDVSKNEPTDVHVDNNSYPISSIEGAHGLSDQLAGTYEPLKPAQLKEINAKVASYSNATPEQQAEMKQLLTQQYQHENAYIKSLKAGGGQGVHSTLLDNTNPGEGTGKTGRATMSNNSPYYQNALKEMGTYRPNNTDWKDLAQNHLLKGTYEPMAPGEKLPPDPRYYYNNDRISKLEQEIASNPKPKPVLKAKTTANADYSPETAQKLSNEQQLSKELGLNGSGNGGEPPILNQQTATNGPDSEKFLKNFEKNNEEFYKHYSARNKDYHRITSEDVIRAGDNAGQELVKAMENNRRIGTTTANFLSDKIKELVPNKNDLKALTLYHEFKSNPEALKQFLNGTHPFYNEIANYALPKGKNGVPEGDMSKLTELGNKAKQGAISKINSAKLKPLIEKALNPTPEMKKASTLIDAFYKDRWLQAKKLGQIPEGEGLGDYISHALRNDDNFFRTNAGGNNLSTSSNFLKSRVRDAQGNPYTYLHDIAIGKHPMTLNSADIVSIYGRKQAGTSAATMLGHDMLSTDLGVLNTPENSHRTAGLVPMPGVKIGGKDVMVAPELAKKFDGVFNGMNHLSEMGATAREYQTYLKSVELSLSLFHAKTLGLVMAPSDIGPFGMFKAMQRMTDSNAYKDAKLFGAKYGLTFKEGNGARTDINKFSSELEKPQFTKLSDKIGNVVVNNPYSKTIEKVASPFEKVTFEMMQEPFKVQSFSQQAASWIGRHPNASEAEKTTALRDIANYVNNTYGGINWEQLGVSKNTRNAFKAVALAPDWLVSQLGNIPTALGVNKASKTVGWQARKSLMLQMALIPALSAGYSMLFGGGYDPTHPFQVYMGKDNKGQNVYSNMFDVGPMGMLTQFGEKLVKDGPIGALTGSITPRLAPGLNGAMQLITNRSYSGQNIYKTTDPLQRQLADVGGWAVGESGLLPVPFSASDVIHDVANNNDPNAKFKYSPKEIVSTALTGAATSHENPKTAKQFISFSPNGKGIVQQANAQGNNGGTNGGQTGDFNPDNNMGNIGGNNINTPFGRVTIGNSSLATKTFENTTVGKKNGLKAAQSEFSTDQTKYVKGVAEMYGLDANMLAGAISGLNGFKGSQQDVVNIAQQIATNMKQGNGMSQQDAIDKLQQGLGNTASQFSIPSSGLNTQTNDNLGIYSVSDIQNGIKNNSYDLSKIPVSYTKKGAVNKTATYDAIKAEDRKGTYGDLTPVMNYSIDQGIKQYEQKYGVKLADSSTGKQLILKAIRFETGYDPSKTSQIPQIVGQVLSNYAQTHNWDTALASLRFQDPTSDQAYQYVQMISNSPTVSGNQNRVMLTANNAFSSTFIPTYDNLDNSNGTAIGGTSISGSTSSGSGSSSSSSKVSSTKQQTAGYDALKSLAATQDKLTSKVPGGFSKILPKSGSGTSSGTGTKEKLSSYKFKLPSGKAVSLSVPASIKVDTTALKAALKDNGPKQRTSGRTRIKRPLKISSR